MQKRMSGRARVSERAGSVSAVAIKRSPQDRIVLLGRLTVRTPREMGTLLELRCRGWNARQSLARRAPEKRVFSGDTQAVRAAHAAARRVMWQVSVAAGRKSSAYFGLDRQVRHIAQRMKRTIP
jgi:hypothetical protein